MKEGLFHKSSDVVGDRYRIEEYLAAGGMQEVYKATDLLLGRRVALKVPKNYSAVKRFKRSAVVSAMVNHHNVAKTLDYIETEERAYLVEELVDGKDLSRVLREDFLLLDPLVCAFLMHRLAKGLAASHHAGVIHRDLKPSNVIAVGGAALADLKITDFGIAKMAEEEIAEAVGGGDASLTASSTAIGALPYMAPEVIRDLSSAGKPSDVWSLGAMMFELLTGKRPFGSGLSAIPTIVSGKRIEVDDRLKSNLQFKPALDQVMALIDSCLVVDPNGRPTADRLVFECGQLCYPTNARESGIITRFDYNSWGFIRPDAGKGVFFHVDSLYGSRRVVVGERVSFARHEGSGNDRAFPVVRMRVNT